MKNFVLLNRMEGKCQKHLSLEKHVCHTCKQEIEDISRVIIMRDKDLGPRLMCFHFFYPCWDIDLICQQYPNLKIDQICFSFPDSLVISEESIKKIQTCPELWA